MGAPRLPRGVAGPPSPWVFRGGAPYVLYFLLFCHLEDGHNAFGLNGRRRAAAPTTYS